MSSREMQGSGVGTLFYRFRHRRLKTLDPLTTKKKLRNLKLHIMPVVFFAWFCFTCVIDMIYPLWPGISSLYYLILFFVL